MILTPGEAKIQISSDPKRQVVLIEFVKPIMGVNMTPAMARRIAASLLRHAGAAESAVPTDAIA